MRRRRRARRIVGRRERERDRGGWAAARPDPRSQSDRPPAEVMPGPMVPGRATAPGHGWGGMSAAVMSPRALQQLLSEEKEEDDKAAAEKAPYDTEKAKREAEAREREEMIQIVRTGEVFIDKAVKRWRNKRREAARKAAAAVAAAAAGQRDPMGETADSAKFGKMKMLMGGAEELLAKRAADQLMEAYHTPRNCG